MPIFKKIEGSKNKPCVRPDILTFEDLNPLQTSCSDIEWGELFRNADRECCIR